MNVNRRRRTANPAAFAVVVPTLLAATALALAPAGSASAAPASLPVLKPTNATADGVVSPDPTLTCLPLGVNGTLASGPAVEMEGQGYFDVTPQAPHWSVVAGKGAQSETISVGLYGSPPSPCNLYDLSTDPDASHTDWVAFDNNSGRLPLTTYAARFYDTGEYFQQFVAGGKVLSTVDPTVSQSMGLGGSTDWMVDIRDVWLVYGSTYTFKVTGGFSGVYVLHSNISNSDTWTRTKYTANAAVELPDSDPNEPMGGVTNMVRTATLRFRPATSGWFGLLVVRNAWWGKPVSVRVVVS